mmetsp:Transcript_36621/g.79758  ORF Transcript_36621/g.79758 Transcript_36621/m.79758 type:complete len:645 (+) Transcript_36621:548-2482(+)
MTEEEIDEEIGAISRLFAKDEGDIGTIFVRNDRNVKELLGEMIISIEEFMGEERMEKIYGHAAAHDNADQPDTDTDVAGALEDSFDARSMDIDMVEDESLSLMLDADSGGESSRRSSSDEGMESIQDSPFSRTGVVDSDAPCTPVAVRSEYSDKLGDGSVAGDGRCCARSFLAAYSFKYGTIPTIDEATPPRDADFRHGMNTEVLKYLDDVRAKAANAYYGLICSANEAEEGTRDVLTNLRCAERDWTDSDDRARFRDGINGWLDEMMKPFVPGEEIPSSRWGDARILLGLSQLFSVEIRLLNNNASLPSIGIGEPDGGRFVSITYISDCHYDLSLMDDIDRLSSDSASRTSKESSTSHQLDQDDVGFINVVNEDDNGLQGGFDIPGEDANSTLPLVRQLTEEEDGIVREALNGTGRDDDILATSDSDSVQRSSIRRLRDGVSVDPLGVWLNDEVIHYYLLLLARRDATLCQQDSKRKRCHFFKSYFMTKFLEEGYSSVQRWSKRVNWSSTTPGDIFSLDKVFFPINFRGLHWVLVVVYMSDRRIQYFDSMGGRGEEYLKAVLSYLKQEHEAKKGRPLPRADEWNLVCCTTDTPRQVNDYDCGVFMCEFCDYISVDEPLAFGQEQMLLFRKIITLSLMKQERVR